jgi:O-antigen/teichoic acid export membrane protein
VTPPGRRLLTSTVALAAARAASGGVFVAATILLAHAAGAAALGAFGLALTVAVYACVAADSGISQYLLPTLARTPRAGWPALWADVLRFQRRSALPYVALYACAVVALTGGQTRLALLAAAPWWLLLRVNGAARSVYTVAERVRPEALATTLESLVTLAALALLLTRTHSPALAVLTLSVGAAVGLGVRLAGLRALGIAGGRARTTARALAHRAGTFNASALLTTLYLRIDIIVLSLVATPLAIGLYQPPIRVATALMILPDALASLLLGRLARSPGQGAARRSQERALAIGIPVGGLLVLVSALVGRQLLVHLYGPAFAPAATALTLMVATVPLALVSSMNGNLLTAQDRQRTRLLCLGGAAVFAVSVGVPAIARWGYTGAAAVSVANELVLALAYGIALCRRDGPAALLLPRVGRLAFSRGG